MSIWLVKRAAAVVVGVLGATLLYQRGECKRNISWIEEEYREYRYGAGYGETDEKWTAVGDWADREDEKQRTFLRDWPHKQLSAPPLVDWRSFNAITRPWLLQK